MLPILPSAILFLKYKSVKSGEEVAERGRKIQSGMKNFYVLRYRSLFQNLTTVLDDDATSAAVDRSAVKTLGLGLCVCGDHSLNSGFDAAKLRRFNIPSKKNLFHLIPLMSFSYDEG